MQNYTHVFTLHVRGIRRYEVKNVKLWVQYCGYTPNIGNSNCSRHNIHAYTWNWNWNKMFNIIFHDVTYHAYHYKFHSSTEKYGLFITLSEKK